MNVIHGLHVQGEWVERASIVKKEVEDYFKERFREEAYMRPKLDGDNFSMLSEEDNLCHCSGHLLRTSEDPERPDPTNQQPPLPEQIPVSFDVKGPLLRLRLLPRGPGPHADQLLPPPS
ncbi:hypothetical protein RJT34_20273 [Clitoria ternatea]|uniref:Uncharacterized protein n=1 Tax=Clitoria ternatea TaxID=43366 RepID=A0AAN9P4T8_CLITE